MAAEIADWGDPNGICAFDPNGLPAFPPSGSGGNPGWGGGQIGDAPGFGGGIGAFGDSGGSCGPGDSPCKDPYADSSPVPNVATGTLMVDPSIQLKCKQFGLQISFNYSSQTRTSGPFGQGRNSTVGGYVLSTTGVGQVVTIIRGNLAARPFTKVGVVGGITTYTGSAIDGCTTTLQYDGTKFTEFFTDGMTIDYQSQVAGGNPVTHQLTRLANATGIVSTFNYYTGADARAGLLKNITIPTGNSVTFSYVAGPTVSLVNSVQDWGGRVWTFQYDSGGYLTTYMGPSGCITKYGYSLAGGTVTQIQTITDPRGYTATYSYDATNRVVSIANGGAVLTYTYNTLQTVYTAPSGAKTTYDFNTDNLLTDVKWPTGMISTYTYTGRILSKTQIQSGTIYSVTYDQTLWYITASDDALGNRTTFQYDSFGNLTTQTNPDGGVWTFAYASPSTRRKTGQTDPLGRRSTFTYTGDGYLSSATDPRGLKTTYNYDFAGNLASMVASDGGIWSHTYETLNRLESSTDPLGRTTSYTYNENDKVLSVTDPTGAVMNYHYSGGNCMLAYSFDALNNRNTFTYGRYGKRLTAQDANSKFTTYSYDNMGYLVSVMDAMGNVTSTVYTSAGLKNADIDALGNATTYSYDTSARLVTVMDARGNISTTTYDAKNVTATVDALGNATSYTYDAVGRRTAVKDPLGHITTTNYDVAGQVVSVMDALGNVTSY
ncbi:MAG: hypothetical protein ABJA67_03180, partial [Chthonomonadales bacterium]